MTSRKSKKIDAIMGQGPMLIEFYRNNPCIAAYDLLGVDLAPIQRIIFEDMWFKNYVITAISRGGGKTFLQGLLATLSAMLYPGYRVGLVGPSFRQSKLIFAEVEKLYAKSSILREATEKRPIRGSDVCYLKFKNVGNFNGAYIEALPLGTDGAKIRGSRFYLMCIDELAQVPDKIIDMVLRPMAATKQDPMAHVRYLEKKRELIEAGLATEDDFETETVNKMIMTSSGFYKFNHMYRRMRAYWQKMDECAEKGEWCPFTVHQVPHKFLPEGFLDKDNVEEALRTMSNHEFRMEYEAEMIADSEGFFKASLLEECTLGSGFSIELTGRSDDRYIIGVDPNQAGDASCGVVVIKIGPINKVVNVMELKKKTTQQLTMAVQDLCDQYNVVRIFMDKGGGGKAVCDLLEEGYNGKSPIIDRTNEDHKHLDGRHILEMINFNTAWIQEANFTTLALLEDKRLMFPQPPVASTIDMEAIRHENVEELKKQMLNIIVTQTAGGALHFDTPKKGQNKDLYSAIILAAYGVRVVEKELEGEPESVLYNNSGMIRQHQTGSSWDILNKQGPTQSFGQQNLSMAVLGEGRRHERRGRK